MTTKTKEPSLDERVIAHYDNTNEVLPEVAHMDSGQIQELMDAMPPGKSDLRRKIAQYLP